MKAILIIILGFFLIIQNFSIPTSAKDTIFYDKVKENTADYTKYGTTRNETVGSTNTTNSTNESQPTILPVSTPNNTKDVSQRSNATNFNAMEKNDFIVIDLEKINKMSPVEFIGRQVKSLWHYLLHGNKQEPERTFIGRCAKIAKKLGQLIPLVMVGGAVIILKLAFLVLFSLKTIGLLGLLLLLNVGSIAAKLGAAFASKKSEKSAQNLHFHVSKSDDHEHSFSDSHHLHGPPYGWDDRNDKNDRNLEGHELYNLYEKLRRENDFKQLLYSVGGKGGSYH